MDWLPWNLVCSIGISGPIVVYSNDDWLDLDPIYIQVKFGAYAFVWEKKVAVYFWKLSEIYFCICNQLNEATWVTKVKVTPWPLTLAQNLT